MLRRTAVLDADLVTQMTDTPAGEDLDTGIQYGLGTMIAENGYVFGHAGCGNDLYATQLLVWPDYAISVALLVPEPNRGDFGTLLDLAGTMRSIVQYSGR